MLLAIINWVLSLCFMLWACPSFGQEQPIAADTSINVVFDLDWTLLNTTTEEMAKANPKDTFKFQGLWYRISEGAVESLVKLHEADVSLSIFSGGTADRNHFVAELLQEMVNKKLRVKDFSFQKVLNLEDFWVASQDPNLRFSERYKKELSRFFDVNRTLIIDDMTTFTVAGQERNLVWLGQTYNDRPEFDLKNLEQKNEKKFSAPNFEEWERDKNKIITAVNHIFVALQLMRSQGISLLQAYYQVDPFKAKFPLCENLF